MAFFPMFQAAAEAVANNNQGLSLIGAGLGAGLAVIGAGLGIGWIGALKGTRNRDAAMRFLAFTMDKDRQVELSNLSGDAPTYADALAKVDPATRKWLPNIADPDNLFVNAAWWDSRIEELNTRFKEWLLT